MVEPVDMPADRAELLAAIDARWQRYADVLGRLHDEQWIGATDAAGWTVKDHVAHVTAWENVVVEVLLHGKPQYETLQISLDDWTTAGMDGANALLYSRKAGQRLSRVQRNCYATHARVVNIIAGLSDEDVLRPFEDFGAVDSPGTVIQQMMRFLVNHYEGHRVRILAFVNN